MKSIYKEFFFVPENGKVSEKVMLARITVAVILMIACLIAMSMTAYAFFSHNVTSVNNVITGGSFEAAVTVTYKADDGTTAELPMGDAIKESAVSGYFLAGTVYTVKLEISEESTATTGFCVVTVDGSEKIFHTQQLGVDGDKETESISFTFTVSKDAAVKIASHWGTSSYYDAYKNNAVASEPYILNGEAVAVEIGDPVSDGGQNIQTDETTGPEDSVYIPETTAPAKTEKPADTKAPANTEKPADTTAPAVTEKPADTTAAETTAAETEGVTEETTKAPEETTAPAETTVPSETETE